MEEKPSLSSALFAGTRFDRKRFAGDIARFRTGAQPAAPAPATPDAAPPGPEKKRKRKSKANAKKNSKKKKKRADGAASASGEASLPACLGFSVFKGAEAKEATEESVEVVVREDEDSAVVRRRKEAEREIERAAILRKRYDIHISGHNVPAPLESFEELVSRYDCDSYLVGNLSKLGFQEPTPIQRQAISILLSGRECFACAPTGSGKTLSYHLPMLMKIKPGSKGCVKAVILCPTRELAAQTTRECKKLAKGRKFGVKLMTKDLSQDDSTYITKWVEYLVLDESDKLFELGFVEVIDSIVKACSNPSIIRSLFSATLPETIEALARTIMHDAVRIIVGRKNSASSMIKQKLIFAGTERGKLIALRQSFAESLNPPVLVFVQSKERAKELYRELVYDDIRVDVIHGDLTEEQRQDAVDNLRAGKSWVLIATEVLARGMDFKGVNCVINYDFPESASAYIHRIGRSGRAGRSGEAITFFTEEDKPFLRNIANVLVSSGCEVPSWMVALPKLKSRKHRVDRDRISFLTDED
uniref:RNA helicase n=1 Tax=Aegilops tauschii TaxID=37682 RepID=M8BNI7_AEGTA